MDLETIGHLCIVIGAVLFVMGIAGREIAKRNGKVRLTPVGIELHWETEPEMVERIIREKEERA